MLQIHSGLRCDGIPLIRLESDYLLVDTAPAAGGKIVRLINQLLDYDFLWRNPNLRLEILPPGSEYDPHFYGGIDELLPNDIPETIDGTVCPDHGELWTTALRPEIIDGSLILRGDLPLSGLRYLRRMTVRRDDPWIDLDYSLTNISGVERHFLWKLHAALSVQAGDRIECPARWARVVDPAWSRFHSLDPFPWPVIEGQAANIIPEKNGAVDFFYLYDLPEGRIAWQRPAERLEFTYQFDTSIFPYAWLFASYGGFDNHYTIILEPCTAMPVSVNEAAALGQCAVLQPGESLQTCASIYAGPLR
ncbi:MAG: hypothetical protein ACE15F_18730 [bacterium]